MPLEFFSQCGTDDFMHIPDNYLSPSTCAVLGAFMLPVWRWGTRKIKKEFSTKNVSLIGVFASFSFLLMMFNLPLPGGTTGHAVGATLIAVLIGPSAACLSLSVALLIQALFFGDGGLISFGVNAFNMAFIMPFAGYFIYVFLKSFYSSERWDRISLFLSAYISLNIGALLAAVEFGIQPILFKSLSGVPVYSPYPLSIAVPAMMVPHLLIAGFVEAVVTVGVYNFIKKTSPRLIRDISGIKLKPVYAMMTAMIILSPIGLLASGTAWGEWSNSEIQKLVGYIPSGMSNGLNYNSFLSGYTVPFIMSDTLGYMLSAAAGVMVIFVIFKVLERAFNAHMDA